MIETIKFITSGAAVKRYHTVTTLTQETVGHHSHVVAMFTLLLKPDASRSLLMAALFHDLAEHQTGDIPSPSKREFGIGNKIEILEHELMASVGIIMPKLSDEEARILKLADIMQGLFFCVRESYLGNRLMDEIGERYFKYAGGFRRRAAL